MSATKDNPGIHIPPPLVYAASFFLSIWIQKMIPLSTNLFHTSAATMTGIVLIMIALFFNIPALYQFAKTRNTIVTIKPARSLQTKGIYGLTRNPMYLSLLLVYTGLSFLTGNWWTLLLLPVLFMVINQFIIKPEERYLKRAFGQTYLDYKKKVRRWL